MTDPTSPLHLRPFQQADAPAVADLVTRSVRGLWTSRPEHFRESTSPERRRLVAVQGGEVVATAHLAPFGDSAPDALRLDLAGEGAAFSPLYLALLAQSELVRWPAGFSRLLGVTRKDFSEKMTFFAAAGFRNAWQSWGAHLDLGTWDPGRFRALEERLFLEGYEAERWRMDAPEAEWQALYALHRRGEADAPRNPTTMTAPLDLPALREVMTREEAVFVVRRRGEVLALTRLTLPQDRNLQTAGEVSSDLTTTHPAHRGRGLATLVKAHALAWAQAEGYARAGTGGAILNLPMLRVNTRLGYVPEAMWVTWERRLRTPDVEVRKYSEL